MKEMTMSIQDILREMGYNEEETAEVMEEL